MLSLSMSMVYAENVLILTRVINNALILFFLLQYVGLSAPMLGALNPLRAVISGENMGYVNI